MTHADFAAASGGVGAAGFIVYDDTACMVEVAAEFSRFLWLESCASGTSPPTS
jgi:NADH-quinone oxidoreductase subunit F